MKKVIAITLVTTLAGIGTAAAHGPHKDRGARMDAHFSRLDTDGDGRIARQEWIAGKLDRFQSADLDGDGRVTPEEMREARQAMKAKWVEKRAEKQVEGDREGRHRRHGKGHHGKRGMYMFKHLDTNQDGVITKEEAQTAAAKRFDKLDADGDGYLTKEELKEGFRAMKEKYGKRGEGKRGHGKNKKAADRS